MVKVVKTAIKTRRCKGGGFDLAGARAWTNAIADDRRGWCRSRRSRGGGGRGGRHGALADVDGGRVAVLELGTD